MGQLFYAHGGQQHPLLEGEYDTAFKVYKSDRRKAEIGNPENCIEARGLKRLPNVAFAHIGSAREAFVGFRDPGSKTGITVRRFSIPTVTARVRDVFETKGAPSTQLLMLKAPANGSTLTNRRKRDKTRRDAVKSGTREPPKKRSKPHSTRSERIGIAHRPRPKIVKGEVTLVQADE